MEQPLAGVSPVPRRPNDHAAVAVHSHLRSLILSGSLAPGAILNQVELAPRLGVSRTPLREAIRMLQEEGLVVAEPQKRARVVGFDPGHLEAVYVQRILFESLAARLTAAAATDAQVTELLRLLGEMGSPDIKDPGGVAGYHRAWQEHHRSFHLLLVSGVQPHLLAAISSQMDRGERYRVLSQTAGPRSWDAANAEHEAIVEAYRNRDGAAAAGALGDHLARTALTLIAQLAPTYDPVALRAALATAKADPERSAGDDKGRRRARADRRNGSAAGAPKVADPTG